MSVRLLLQVSDDTYAQIEARATAQRRTPELSAQALLHDAAVALPVAGRAVVVSGPDLQQLEAVLGGGSVLSGGDLVAKVLRLAGISFLHVRLPFTPNQLELLAEKAERQGLTVDQLVERTAPRIYEQFFDLVERSR